MEAEQMCLSIRGIKKPGASTVTTAFRGTLKDDAKRAEALVLIKGR
jgi:GTP cyclohydrolase I